MNERYLKYKDMINTKYLKDTILNASYLCDRDNPVCKPELTNEELTDLLSNQQKIRSNKQKIFDNLVWYAAYISQQVYWDRYKVLYLHVDYNEYLQFALERVWGCLDKYDAKAFNCSIYTYILNDYRFRIRKHIEDMYNELGIRHSTLTDKYRSILRSLVLDNLEINCIFDMSDEKFNDIYGCNRKAFLCYVAGMNVISIDDTFSHYTSTKEESVTIKDTLSDKYSEEIYKLIDAKFVIDDIKKLVLTRWKKCRNIYRDYQIFEEYAMTNITYEELGKRYGITREGIRVIINKFKWRLYNTRSIKRIIDENE